ncbi:hypothetical protein N431DRAFT_465121 [Stipitochalara longipes BDJ]|nr:hypothetical protein N431DRAFT_465121 [Stipitochalara longipes BDJ]
MAQQTHQYTQNSMLDPASASRRPITSCLECYRRKQKCNRVRPCNQCCTRNVPEKCCFISDLVVTGSPSANAHMSAPLEAEEDDSSNAEATLSSPSLASQAGYSASPGSSTFMRLKSKNLFQGGPSLPTSSSISHQRLKVSYLRITAQLPSPDIIDTLLEHLFRNVYWTFMVIDENHLQNLLHQWLATPTEEYIAASPNSFQAELLYFPTLLFPLLAQILHNLSPQHPAAKALKLGDYNDCDRLSQTYYLLGSKLVALIGRQHPTLCLVEHEIVSGAWLKDSSRGREAWQRLGNAIRQAQELGLHRLPQIAEQTPDDSLECNLLKTWDLERRKRIWTRLFILDSLQAVMLGRPRLINREDFSTQPPLNIEYPKDPARTLPLSSDNSPAYSMTILLSLGHKVHDMLSLSAKGVFIRDYSRLLAIHDEISSLRYQVPLPPLPEQGNQSIEVATTATLRLTILRLSLLNTINAVLMALHRPMIASQLHSRSAAVNAALESLDLQQSIFDLIPHSQSRFYGTTFSTIETCVFLCGIMVELPPQDPVEDRRIRQAILHGISRLSAIKNRSTLAESGEKILQQFYQDIQAAQQPAFEEVVLFQSQSQPTELLDEIDHLGNVSIPSPQQPAYESFQSLFGTGESLVGSFESTHDQDWDFGDLSQGSITDFSNPNNFF